MCVDDFVTREETVAVPGWTFWCTVWAVLYCALAEPNRGLLQQVKIGAGAE